MEKPNIKNVVVDEANQRTYVILAPRLLSDGEIYKTIRREILRRGGKHPAHGETVTLTFAAKASGEPTRMVRESTGGGSRIEQ